MNQRAKKPMLVLAIAPSSRGFGFAMMDENHALVDWGVKTVKGDRNAMSLAKVANLVELYQPTIMALEDLQSPGVRRFSRIQALVQSIIELAAEAKISVKQFRRQTVRRGLLSKPAGTKYEVASQLATRFPAELGLRLPRKRRIWMSEDSRMDIFDAVALAEHCLSSSRKDRRSLEPSQI